MVEAGRMMVRSEDIVGEAYHHELDDVLLLKTLAKRLPEKAVVINIGACFGTSAMAFLESRECCYVFSVDVAECPAEEENLRRAYLWGQHRCVRVLGRSQEVGLHWPFLVDLVLVDGSHARQDVEDDIRAWLPRVRAGGFIVFDDYGKPICPEVKPVVDELMVRRYPVELEVGDMIAFRIDVQRE